MHSVLDGESVLSDPSEVLCCIGTLIIEGRTPRTAFGSNLSGEGTDGILTKVKPYSEGPHCPTHVKLYAKDTHKCVENNALCIRHKNLRQHLEHLHRVSSSVVIEVSLGPDCLCGEFRSQSTSVSGQTSKRDTVLEQWIISTVSKETQGSSSSSSSSPPQMSVANVYQAVRSLLHFSQLTAWYMSTGGMKPAHVMYRAVIPEDATYIADDDFITHSLPMIDVNKSVSMKISLKTMPRKKTIPAVFCLQHPCSSEDSLTISTVEELSVDKMFPTSTSSAPSSESKEDLLNVTLPLKFHGGRKKASEAQERKRKKHITLYGSTTPPPSLNNRPGVDILDSTPLDAKNAPAQLNDSESSSNKRFFPGKPVKPCNGEPSKAEFKKPKPATLTAADFSGFAKAQKGFQAEVLNAVTCKYIDHKSANPALDHVLGLSGFSEAKKKCDFRTKGLSKDDKVDSGGRGSDIRGVMDILDDRMQISCAISGKHHCKWECEEETDLSDPRGNAEKPKRRRSLSRAKLSDDMDVNKVEALEFDKGVHGKFKEVKTGNHELSAQTQENPTTEANELEIHTSRMASDFPGCSQTFTEPPCLSCNTNVNAINSTANIKCLPLVFQEDNEKNEEKKEIKSSRKDDDKTGNNSGCTRGRESLESFRRGCAIAENVASGCPSDSDDDILKNLSNPLLAAIMRTTKRSKNSKKRFEKEGLGKPMKESDFHRNLENPFKCFLNSKEVKKAEKVEKKAIFRNSEKQTICSGTGTCKSAAVKGPKELYLEDVVGGTFNGRKVENDGEKGNAASDDNSHVKTIPVPSAHDKLRFRRSLDTAAQLVFHRCSGLPLTSSPAPVRRNNNSFAFDSSLNSVSAIKSALFETANSLSSEDENESEGSLKSPASPGAWSLVSKRINYHTLSPLPLLGSFEESVLNGRLEPVSTVQGFTAELGASGSFCPRHLHLPVTVFFYTLGDNDKVSAPYLGHINLGKKGYSVPRSGTIQVTLFNPLRTVVKMFVVVYDLTDMPANSHTFLRQRTLYVPASQKESVHTDRNRAPFDQGDYHKHLRYLIHLRFVSGKTGRIYLHTDIRMVIFRKADEDTATALGKQVDGETYELRSHTNGPVNPKFSPRK